MKKKNENLWLKINFHTWIVRIEFLLRHIAKAAKDDDSLCT